ncbi:MAG TPA: alpha/beta hydrolase-fold protein [Candidatus Limnocylindria bacterium]|nr:alpha/beta hydrolase-fold protein [Candidatus Limnocylindria bacterium]
MKRDYQVWRSPALGRHMEMLVFGESGMPVIVFPTSMGRFYQWEDFGMVGHLAPRIENGWIQLWCVDSVDAESFYDKGRSPQERARRHFAYERYLVDEVIPRIGEANPNDFRCLLGASFGAFHAALLALRHPEAARKVVCLSGAYDSARWLDGVGDGDCYFVNPLAFLPGLDESRYLDPLRRVEFEIVAGEEDANVHESRRMAALLQQKGVPARLHVWEGWAHDWPYWRQMVDIYV